MRVRGTLRERMGERQRFIGSETEQWRETESEWGRERRRERGRE